MTEASEGSSLSQNDTEEEEPEAPAETATSAQGTDSVPGNRIPDRSRQQIIGRLLCLAGAAAAGCLSPRWYLLPYCLLCGMAQGVAEGYFAAMFAPFFGRFVARGMRLTLSLLFWFTPVAWPAARADGMAAAQWLSPIGYVVDATRACLIAGAPPPTWQRALWFWCAMAALAALGALGSSRLHEPYREVL